MLKRIALLPLGCLAAGLAAAPAGAETVLRISSWAPPTHFLNATVWPTWGKWVTEATQGRVKTKIEYKLASPLKQFGVVRDGIADAGWIFHGYNTRYVATQVVEMPDLGTSAEAAGLAYWKVHEKYLHKAREHRGTVLLGLMSHGPAVIHTKKPLKALSDLKGLKIRVPGGVGSLVGKALGVTAVKLPAPKVYEALSSGVADGIFMPMETQKTFRLKEVVPACDDHAGRALLRKLRAADQPRHAQEAVRRRPQGGDERFRRKAVAGSPARCGMPGTRPASPRRRRRERRSRRRRAAMKKAYLALMKPVEEAWIERASKGGYDARAALAELRQTARAYDKAK